MITLNHYERLERAYEKGWLLSTSEIAGLWGLSPGSITKEFERRGFQFSVRKEWQKGAGERFEGVEG
mgnify:CR=1 FL=1